MKKPKKVKFDLGKNTTTTYEIEPGNTLNKKSEKSKKLTKSKLNKVTVEIENLQAKLESLLAQKVSLETESLESEISEIDSLVSDSSETESLETLESSEMESSEMESLKTKGVDKYNSNSNTPDVNIKQGAPVSPSRERSLRDNIPHQKATDNSDQTPVSPQRQGSLRKIDSNSIAKGSSDKKPVSPQRQGSLRKIDSNSNAGGNNNQTPLIPKRQKSLPRINLELMAKSNSQQASQSSEIMNGLDPQAFGIAKNVDKIPANGTPKGRARAQRVLAENNKTTKSTKSLKGPG